MEEWITRDEALQLLDSNKTLAVAKLTYLTNGRKKANGGNNRIYDYDAKLIKGEDYFYTPMGEKLFRKNAIVLRFPVERPKTTQTVITKKEAEYLFGKSSIRNWTKGYFDKDPKLLKKNVDYWLDDHGTTMFIKERLQEVQFYKQFKTGHQFNLTKDKFISNYFGKDRLANFDSVKDVPIVLFPFVTAPNTTFRDWFNINCENCDRTKKVRNKFDLGKRGGCVIREKVLAIREHKDEIAKHISENNIEVQDLNLSVCRHRYLEPKK